MRPGYSPYHTAWHSFVSCSQAVTAPYSVERLKTRIPAYLFSVHPNSLRVMWSLSLVTGLPTMKLSDFTATLMGYGECGYYKAWENHSSVYSTFIRCGDTDE